MNAELEADEFLIARTLEAPRADVFRAWTDARWMAQWWGPRGFTNPVCDLDPRMGGAWRIVMRGPDGVDYPAKGVYREVAEPERIVLTMDCSEHPAEWHDLVDPDRPPEQKNPVGEMVLLVTFDECEDGTTLTIRMRFESPVIRDALLEVGMNEGWSEGLERLDELLSADREVLTARVIDAPRDVVFRAFGEPEHLAQWWGPEGFRNTFREFEFRAGGNWKFIMHGPDGVDYANHSVFEEIVPSERIVFRHLGDPEHSFRMTILFAEEGARTRLTWRMRFDTAAQCDAVRSFVAGANEENFDRLESELAQMDVLSH